MAAGGTLKRTLQVIIAGDAAGLQKSLGTVKTSLGQTFKNAFKDPQAFGGAMRKTGAEISMLGAGLDALAAPLESSEAKLKATFSAAGTSVGKYKGQIDNLNSRMENLGHTNADTEDALAKLTAASQNPKKALADMALVANIAAFKHVSLADAAGMVVKMHAGAGKVFKEFGLDVSTAGKSEKVLTSATKGATSAHGALLKAQERLKAVQDSLVGKHKLTRGELLRLQKAHADVSRASDAYKAAQNRVSDAAHNATTKQHDLDGALKKLGDRLKGQATEHVKTFSGKLEVWKTKIQDVAAEIGKKLGPALTAAGPAMMALGGAISAGLGPVLLITAGIAALVAAVIYAYNHWTGFRNVVDKVRAWIVGTLWPALQRFAHNFMDAMRSAIDFVMKVWHSLEPAIKLVWEGIKNVVQGALNIIKGVIDVVMGVIHGDWSQIWDGIKSIVGGVWDTMKGLVQEGLGWLLAPILWFKDVLATVWDGIWGGLGDVVSSMWDGIVSAVQGGVNVLIHAINWFIHGLNSISFTVPDWLPSWLGGGKTFGIHIDDIPDWGGSSHPHSGHTSATGHGGGSHRLASGGVIAPRPGGTVATLAEAGLAEAVLRVKNGTIVSASRGDMTGEVHVHIHGSFYGDEAKFARYVSDVVMRQKRTGGPLAAALAV